MIPPTVVNRNGVGDSLNIKMMKEQVPTPKSSTTHVASHATAFPP
jgi:hypothetical protein